MSSGKSRCIRLSLLVLVAALCCLSCSKGPTIKLPEDYSCVYSMDNKISGFLPDKNKNKFIVYISKGMLSEIMPQLGKSSIDSLMAPNTDWQTIVYYKGPLSDTTVVTNFMRKSNCGAPVVFNDNDQFMVANGTDKGITFVSYFLDKTNRWVGGWLVGGAPFEKQFNATKRKMER